MNANVLVNMIQGIFVNLMPVSLNLAKMWEYVLLTMLRLMAISAIVNPAISEKIARKILVQERLKFKNLPTNSLPQYHKNSPVTKTYYRFQHWKSMIVIKQKKFWKFLKNSNIWLVKKRFHQNKLSLLHVDQKFTIFPLSVF